MSKQVMQKGLDALERCTKHGDEDYAAIEALRAAIAAPEPEPVGFFIPSSVDALGNVKTWEQVLDKTKTALYLDPPDAEALRKELERVKGERDAMAKRLNWIQRNLFGHKWNGVVDSGSLTHWDIWPGYRHVTAKMIGNTFEDAIDAAHAAQGEGA